MFSLGRIRKQVKELANALKGFVLVGKSKIVVERTLSGLSLVKRIYTLYQRHEQLQMCLLGC